MGYIGVTGVMYGGYNNLAPEFRGVIDNSANLI